MLTAVRVKVLREVMIIVKFCDDECVFKIRFTIAQTECDVAEQQGMNENQSRVGLRR